MALVKCKECGEDVSTKAKICQKCGAKAPKKTSLITWLALAFIIFVIYAANKSPTSTGSSTISKSQTSTSSSAPEVSKTIIAPKPSWKTSTSKDEMTGKLSAYASSPVSRPSKEMSFPYGDVHAWLGIGCNSESEWVYIGFNSSPNLANDKTEDGYNLIETRIKWDDKMEHTSLTQKWGAKFLHFRQKNSTMSKIDESKSALLELQWHGQQAVYFRFTLNGSSKALGVIRTKCSKY